MYIPYFIRDRMDTYEQKLERPMGISMHLRVVKRLVNHFWTAVVAVFGVGICEIT